MNRVSIFAAAAALAIAAGAIPAAAAPNAVYFKAGELYGYCTKQNGSEVTMCFNYIVGVSDALTAFSEGAYCVPSGTNYGQLKAPFMDMYLAKMSDRPAAEVVAEALIKAFPCA